MINCVFHQWLYHTCVYMAIHDCLGYNAEKTKIGFYLTSPIYRLRFKCHLCPGYIELHTDPKNAEYKIIGGIRKRVEDFNPQDAEIKSFKSKLFQFINMNDY